MHMNYSGSLIVILTMVSAVASAGFDFQPVEDQLIHMLYSKSKEDLADTGRQVVYKAWGKYPGLYIVASYEMFQGDLTKDTTIPVDTALIQLDKGKPTVVARYIFPYKHEGSDIRSLYIDTANYQISSTETAFGLRIGGAHWASGSSSTWETLDLFTVRDKSIVHVAGHFYVSVEGGAGNEDQYVEERRKAIVVVRSSKANGYFDLIEKTTESTKTFVGSQEKRTPAKRTSRLFQWEGQRYRAK